MRKFFYDTDSELRYDIAKELKIDKDVIRMPYSIDNKEFLADLGETFNAKDFFDLLRKGASSSTAALNPAEYMDYLLPWAEKGSEVFYVSFGSNFSGTFNNLDIALKDIKKIHPNFKFTRYDTKAISMATGLIVIRAAQLFNQNKNTKDIVKELDLLTPYINAVFFVDDLQHLKRGGRVSSLSAIIGGILQIKPIIKLSQEGRLAPAQKVTGRNKAMRVMMEEIIENFNTSFDLPLIILNGDCMEDAKRLEKEIKARRPEIEIWQYDVGPVIGTHCGPGTLGLCYPGKARPQL